MIRTCRYLVCTNNSVRAPKTLNQTSDKVQLSMFAVNQVSESLRRALIVKLWSLEYSDMWSSEHSEEFVIEKLKNKKLEKRKNVKTARLDCCSESGKDRSRGA